MGDLRGSYIMRTLNSADFRYDSARDKLLSLQVQSRGNQSMLYTTVTDEPADAYGDDHEGQHGSVQGSLMRLGASLNLESYLTVGPVAA
jgi:DNA mismatch repair protein MSH5